MLKAMVCNLAAILLLASPATAQSSIDVTRLAEEGGFSGTILVDAPARLFYENSFGFADRSFAVPAANDTRYRIASVTKLFTAVLVLQLVDQGQLNLKTPIAAYLPDFPGGGADRVTIHQLLNHTSGLRQFDRAKTLQDALDNGMPQYQLPQTPKSLLAYCCSDPLAHDPGTTFDYNNADYIVLGRILERVTGKSFEALLQENILDPLGMKNSGIAYQDRITPRLAPTYYLRPDTKLWVNDLPFFFQNHDASGAMFSTVADLKRFADALYGGRLISAPSLEKLLTPGLDDYGYGLWTYSVKRGGKDFRVAKRPGAIMGAQASVYRLVDEKVTIILLANSNAADLDVMAQKIADMFLPAKETPKPNLP